MTLNVNFKVNLLILTKYPFSKVFQSWMHENSNLIDQNDVDVLEMDQEEEHELNILDATWKQKGRNAKCWDRFKLILTGRVVDGVIESKVVRKYCQQQLVWQRALVPPTLTVIARHVKSNMCFLLSVKRNCNLVVQPPILLLRRFPRGCIRRRKLEHKW